MDLTQMSAYELAQALRRREASTVEAAEAALARIEVAEPSVHAFLHVDPERTLRQAAEAQKRLDAGDAPAVCGLPIALKDNLSTAGLPTTCASRMLERYVPPYDATVVGRLAAAGAVALGKTNLDEFAMGSSTENSAFVTTRNPWDTARVPGGSSGGSAAAVAAGEAVWSLGSDTGGSIRQPAAFCGVVGLKPTYGRVSRFGLVAFASSLDQIGPFSRDVRDAALLLTAISGHDPLDSTSIDQPVPDYAAGLTGELKGLRVGVPSEYFAAAIAPEVKAAVTAAIARFEELGARLVEVSLPHTEYALATYYLIAPAEASSNLARYDGVRYGLRVAAPDTVAMFKETRAKGFGAEVKRRILLGTYALSAGYYDAYYLRALKVRRLIKDDFDRAFAECDVLATPTTPSLPFKVGERTNDPLAMYASDLCTIPANMAGLPALSMPCAFSAEGLPIGLQLIGPALGEAQLLQAAYGLEQALGLAPAFAPLATGGVPHV